MKYQDFKQQVIDLQLLSLIFAPQKSEKEITERLFGSYSEKNLEEIYSSLWFFAHGKAFITSKFYWQKIIETKTIEKEVQDWIINYINKQIRK